MPAHTQVPYTTLEVVPVPAQIQLFGLCGGAEVDLFFREDVASQHKALSICAACPLQKACLSYALDNEEYGVWGGTTESQRAALRGESKLITPEQRIQAARIREALVAGIKTVRQIAEAFEVTERTIYRYKARMREDGLLPLEHEDALKNKRLTKAAASTKKSAPRARATSVTHNEVA
mgnify:FL=1